MLLSAFLRPHHLSRRFHLALVGVLLCSTFALPTLTYAAQQAVGALGVIAANGSQAQSNTARGSTVQAGGDVTIVATGAAPNGDLSSDLTIQGSGISAGNTATLAADGSINLLAAQNTSAQTSANTSSSGSIGVSFNLGVKNTGVSVGISASKGKGSANGSDTTYSTTHIAAGEKVHLQSGADTTLKGAVVTAPQVQAQIGGNLAIESLQDSSDYHSQQSNKGISLSVPIAGTGSASGSISAGKSSINSDYQSVAEQSSIRAGDGGFQVSVGGDTKLVGGQITSTQKAIDDNKNSFNTGGTLSTEDLHNTADYSAKAVGVQLGTSVNHTGQYQPSGTSAGVGKDSGSASSTTTAGISGVTESGNPQVRTGDAQTGLANTFDAGKVQADINAQVQITQSFGQQASKAVGDYAQAQMQKTQALRAASQEQEALAIEALWGESGSLRLAAHTVIGGLTGGSSGAAGAAVGCRNARRITVKSLLTTSEWIGHQAYKPTLPNPTAAGSGAAMKISMVYCANTSRKSDAWRLSQRMSWL